MKYLLLLIGVILSGCAAMERDAQERVCNQAGAYQYGVNDAQNGENMRADMLAHQCHPSQKNLVKRFYIDGYMAMKNQPLVSINNNVAQKMSVSSNVSSSIGAYAVGNQDPVPTSTDSAHEISPRKKSFYFGLIKAFETVKVSVPYYYGNQAEAEQKYGFTFQYQNINPNAAGLLAGISFNQYEGSTNATRLIGAGTYGINEIFYADAGVSLTNIAALNAPSTTGLGFLFEVGARFEQFSGSLGYNYTKNSSGDEFFKTEVELSGMALSAGLNF